MRRLATILASLLVLGVLLHLALPSALDPAAFEPRAARPLEGALAANDGLAGLELLGEGELEGPEDVEVDAEGRLYCGNEDGAVRRLTQTLGGGWRAEIFADTGGRPLGLDFGSDGTLWAADHARGLVSVDPEGRATVRLEHVDGRPVNFADDVDVGPDGLVYFSDASARFGHDELHLEPLEARPWGRLVEFDPATERGKVLLDGLYFANGVAVADDGTFVLVAETFRYRVRRYWLSGPRAGEDEVFLDRLPGFPDGVSSDGRGGFWLALYSLRVPLLDDVLHPRPWLKRLVGRIPGSLHPTPKPYGLVMRLDGSGRIVESLHDPAGERFPFVTSVEEFDGVLYLGSVESDSIGRLKL